MHVHMYVVVIHFRFVYLKKNVIVGFVNHLILGLIIVIK